MTDIPIPHEIADSPLGPRLEWLLWLIRESDGKPSDDELATTFEDVERARMGIALALRLVPRSTLTHIGAIGESAVFGVLEVDGQVWDFGLSIEATPPYRIKNFGSAERAPGVVLRDATDADAATLREIELQVPVVSGDTSVIYDRGRDYFEAERLMGDAITHVVEMGGRVVGLTSWVVHPVRVNGAVMLGSFKHKMRLLKEARGQGARQMLDFAGFSVNAARDYIFYTYSAVGNDNVHHIYGEGRWKVHPERIVIDTAANAGPPAGRPASVADRDRIVDLLNRAHSHEEMFVPDTADSLTERMNREPRAYSWPNLRLSERAVLGVWPAHLNVVRTTGGATTTDDRGLVLDYGYDEGAEDELLALIRAECAALAEAGSTELAIFTCPQSSAYARLSGIAKRIEPYMIHISLPPPDDLAERGMYVDQLYF